MFRIRIIPAMLFAAGFGFSSLAAGADSATDEARTLLDAGRAKAAYELLEPLESAKAGEPRFDFLLGLAALEIGHNTRAVFALERVLAMEPGNVRARAEIARAYLALGEAETARQEFETVQKQGVPADVSLTLERFIAAARRVEDQGKPSLNGYVEIYGGYDTNVNVGPNRSSVVIPGISSSPAILSDDSKANADFFGNLAAGVNGRIPLSPSAALLGGVSGSYRMHQDKEQFDLGSGEANAGLVTSSGKHVWTVMGQAAQVNVDDRRYRKAIGATGQWQYNLDARNQLSGFVQYSALHYPRQQIRDADRWVAGGAYAHMWRDGAVGFASLYGVTERPESSDVRFIGFDGLGMRLGARANIGANTTLFGGVSYELRRYDARDPSFATVRKDNQYGMLFGATYAFARDWTLTPQLNLTRNQSNTELNTYHREILSLAIRREF